MEGRPGREDRLVHAQWGSPHKHSPWRLRGAQAPDRRHRCGRDICLRT